MRQRIRMGGEILILAHTPNDAKQIETHLRGAGHAVHVLVAPGLDSFTDIMEKSDIFVAIHDIKFADCNLIQVSEAVHRSKPDLAILQLNNNSDPRTVTEAMSKGANGIISLTTPAHLEMVLQNEFRNYTLHTELKELREKIAHLQNARTQDLGTTTAPGLRAQEGIIVHANKALVNALKLSDAEDLIGLPLMDLIAPEDQALVKQTVKSCMKDQGSDQPIEFTLLSEAGVKKRLQARFLRIEHDDEPALEIRGIETATSAGETDSNFARVALYEGIRQASAMAVGSERVILTLIRLDEFEQIEQRAGYAGAEEVVVQAMKMFTAELGNNDQLFRFSLSEFVLLGRHDNIEPVQEFVARLQSNLSKHVFKAADKEITCGASAVLYPLAKEPEPPEDLLRKIRGEAMALEKAGGNGLKLVGSTAADMERKQANTVWLGRIKQALANDNFDLAFQNIASLSGEERQFSDILLRMHEDDGKEVLAREFMPAAEENGLMPQIDRWVINRVAQVIQREIEEKNDALFFVRVSEETLAEGDTFVGWLEAFTKANAHIKGHLALVIRESHLENHMNRAQTLVTKTRALGLSPALDRFGMSRNSAQLLERLKLDYVKLHADFTASIGKPRADMDSLESLMQTAKNLKVKTIAERVTDANGMARLWQLGVNYIMGSHVHEPETELTNTRFRLK